MAPSQPWPITAQQGLFNHSCRLVQLVSATCVAVGVFPGSNGGPAIKLWSVLSKAGFLCSLTGVC